MFADIKTLAMFSFVDTQARTCRWFEWSIFRTPPLGWDLRNRASWVQVQPVLSATCETRNGGSSTYPRRFGRSRAPMKVWHVRAFTEALVQDRARPPRRELRDSRPCSRSGTV